MWGSCNQALWAGENKTPPAFNQGPALVLHTGALGRVSHERGVLLLKQKEISEQNE